MENTYNISEVADKLKLSTKTLRRWEESGKFTPSRTEGNQRRYTLSDIHILDAIKSGIINSQKDLLKREDLPTLLEIDEATLNDWEQKGEIHPLVTASGLYYPKARILAKLKSQPPTPAPIKPTLTPLSLTPVKSPGSLIPGMRSPDFHSGNEFSPQASAPLTHHDFWVLVLLNTLITLCLILLYHIVSS